MIELVNDPGLPPSPPLYFDADERRAFVSIRVADWRAIERGHVLTDILLMPGHVVLFYWCWTMTPHDFPVPLRAVLAILGYSLVFRVAEWSARATFPKFFARVLFAKTLFVEITRDLVGVKTWLYGVATHIEREHHGRSLGLQFTLQPDIEADERKSQRNAGSQRSNLHLMKAKILELVVRGTLQQSHSWSPGQNQELRVIPLASMDSRQGEKLTVILNAALALTQAEQGEPTQQTFQHGVDIDTIFNQRAR